MNRCFTENQKAQLLQRAKFKCCNCGNKISFGLCHADHIVPWVKGGKTIISNGQALCISCNLKKGKTMFKPLPWQEKTLKDYIKTDDQTDFVLVAGTGCGKTGAGAICARHSLNKHPRDTAIIIVAVPYRAIKSGWRRSFEDLGLSVSTNNRDIAEDTEVIITTYAGASGVLDYVGKEMDRKYILVFDEFHHMEENNSWAKPFIQMDSDLYVKRLFLSGTPWHEKGDLSKSMVTYNEENEVKANYTYTYGENVNGNDKEKNTVEVIFHPKRIAVSYDRTSPAGVVQTMSHDTDTTIRSGTIGPFVRFSDVVELSKCDGLVSLLGNAINELDNVRRSMPNAGGIIFVQSKSQAEAVKALMESHFQKTALLVSSDDPKSHRNLDEFKDSRDEWIISIDMVSEGVDIPRLKVVADLSNRTTLLHIIQRWGRVLRLYRDSRGNPGRNTEARIFFIDHAQLRYVANMIEGDIKRNKREVEEPSDNIPENVEYIYGQAEHEFQDLSSIFKGKSIDEQIEIVANWIIQNDFNNVQSDGLGYKHALNLASYLIKTGTVPDEVLTDQQEDYEQPIVSKTQKKQKQIDAYSTIISRIAYRHFDGDFNVAMRCVNKKQGVKKWTKDHMDFETLKARVDAAKEVENELLGAA